MKNHLIAMKVSFDDPLKGNINTYEDIHIADRRVKKETIMLEPFKVLHRDNPLDGKVITLVIIGGDKSVIGNILPLFKSYSNEQKLIHRMTFPMRHFIGKNAQKYIQITCENGKIIQIPIEL